MQANNFLTIVSPADKKRYRLNIKGEVGQLTVGQLKECLGAAVLCSIPAANWVLKLSGIPLDCNDEVCAAYGITSGSTLTLENKKGDESMLNKTASSVSPYRRLSEYNTIREHEVGLGNHAAICENTIKEKIGRVQERLQSVGHRKTELELEVQRTQWELKKAREAEELAQKEQQRLARLRQEEAQHAAQRSADLAARREQLQAEEAASRAIALQKLENERRRMLLEKQRGEYEMEKQRLQREREAYERRAKERELAIRAKEMDIEHQILAAERDRREVEVSRLVSQKNRVLYFDRLGMPPPLELMHTKEQEQNLAHPSPASSRSFPLAQIDLSSNATWNKAQNEDGKLNQPPSGFLKGLVNSSARGHNNNSSLQEGQVLSKSGGGVATMTTTMANKADESLAHHHYSGLYDAHENAKKNLVYLGKELGLKDLLKFDDNNTCVIGVDGAYSLLITFDAESERLYVYSTLLTAIPQDSNARLRLYDFLMEGALLGREMCGGGVGASIKNDFIILSTSIYLPTSLPTTLAIVVPNFLLVVNKWRERLQKQLCEGGVTKS